MTKIPAAGTGMKIKRQISVENHGYYVELPDDCPVCHHHSELEVVRSDFVKQSAAVEVVYRCAYAGCRRFFIGYYGPRPQPELRQVKPIMPVPTAFPASVTALSPLFIEVYNEAEEAHQNGLAQITGPGYRKAFEFLIKDYAKSVAPDKANEIEKKFSGKVVDDFIADPRIQAVAKRCLWLGNDEAHYLRKWEEQDIGDLMALIRLTASWIEIEHETKKYMTAMPDGKTTS